MRTPEESKILRLHGSGIQAFQLQGNLVLSTAEFVAHDVMAAAGTLDALIIDLKHVLAVNESACRLLHQLLLKLHSLGKPVLFSNVALAPQLRRFLKIKLKDQFETLYRAFDDTDSALEWCENRLLARELAVRGDASRVAPGEYELFAGLDASEMAVVQTMLDRRTFRSGEVIVEFGAPAGELFFLARGCASVTIPLPGGVQKRLATFSPGMSFGEMAMLDRAPRSAVVSADTEVECDLLKIEDFERLGKTHPRIEIILLRNLALGLSRKLRKANREISVFDV